MMARRKAADGPPDDDPGHRVRLKLDEVLASRGMTLAELSRQVGVSQVNLSVLKNGHARAIRFSTLTAICDVLGCSPGDLLEVTSLPGSSPPVVPPPHRGSP